MDGQIPGTIDDAIMLTALDRIVSQAPDVSIDKLLMAAAECRVEMSRAPQLTELEAAIRRKVGLPPR